MLKPALKRMIILLSLLTGRKSKITLTPLSDLEGGDGVWRATGYDPAFMLHGWFAAGWNELFWYGETEDYIPLKLYWDSGQGFSESQSFVFGEIPKGKQAYRKLVYIPRDAVHVRIDPGEKKVQFVFRDIRMKKVTKAAIAWRSVKEYVGHRGFSYTTIAKLWGKGREVWRNEGLKAVWSRIKQNSGIEAKGSIGDYPQWMKESQESYRSTAFIQDNIASLPYQPLISVIVPVYNVDEVWLRKCLDSVLNQYYGNWELCIADDASTEPHIKPLLQEYMKKDNRIKVIFRDENGHISRSSNSALELAVGEYVALLDHDDELAREALYENVLLLNEHRDADVIYSDEDKISVKGERHNPFFKPDWMPDQLMGQMYTCHLSLYRKTLIDQVGGFRVGYEGSQDFDLTLRVAERTDRIYHIPKILYHWRTIPTSTASSSGSKDYTQDAGYRAVQDAIRRRGIPASVEPVAGRSNTYNVKYEPVGEPKVSIIIPTRNMASTLELCVQSIFEKTDYHNYEIVVVDNGSDEEEIFRLYERWTVQEPDRFKVHTLDIPFNYSRLNNFGVEQTTGELLLLLNNDIEVITASWLRDMAGQAIRPEIGAVGAALYYPDDTLQHGGVVLGIGGVAGHSHKHFPANHPGHFNRLCIPSNYTAVTAACLMLRKEVYLEVGGLEEQLQVAFNDVDLCLKIWSNGYNNIWLPDVRLYHYESKSRGYEDTPEKKARFSSEYEWIKAKWSDVLANDPAYNPNLADNREDFSIGHYPKGKYRNNQAVCRYPRKPLAITREVHS
ncbi:glycosyltransferase family 2 protein [Paenibacillus sp. JX-17]|uniref:Glycosyltransferase family 2 protein n=1 Tax=Paenibacillus lacisoli TaxID=3064525 RepID=A0ABT9CHU5_9BACL|nr:glycosyltransferase family 2 protein [Paenibacillus sp. JX-17]MDO7908852.1 glycosyltransferase family 2 protein [Paenibacillus sp. JX-17]